MDLENSILIFNLGEEKYGIKIKYVKEIVEYKDITRIPLSEEYIKGVANIRGSICNILDINNILSLNSISENSVELKKKYIILLDNNKYGFIADSLSEIVKLSPEDFTPKEQIFNNIVTISDVVTDIVKINNDIIAVINLEKYMDSKLDTKLDIVI